MMGFYCFNKMSYYNQNIQSWVDAAGNRLISREAVPPSSSKVLGYDTNRLPKPVNITPQGASGQFPIKYKEAGELVFRRPHISNLTYQRELVPNSVLNDRLFNIYKDGLHVSMLPPVQAPKLTRANRIFLDSLPTDPTTGWLYDQNTKVYYDRSTLSPVDESTVLLAQIRNQLASGGVSVSNARPPANRGGGSGNNNNRGPPPPPPPPRDDTKSNTNIRGGGIPPDLANELAAAIQKRANAARVEPLSDINTVTSPRVVDEVTLAMKEGPVDKSKLPIESNLSPRTRSRSFELKDDSEPKTPTVDASEILMSANAVRNLTELGEYGSTDYLRLPDAAKKVWLLRQIDQYKDVKLGDDFRDMFVNLARVYVDPNAELEFNNFHKYMNRYKTQNIGKIFEKMVEYSARERKAKK